MLRPIAGIPRGENTMAGFLDHLRAEIQALERSLEVDPRYIKLRELQRVRALYDTEIDTTSTDSQPLREAGTDQPRKKSHREMSPATRRVVDAARDYLLGRAHPVPLRDLYHEISEVRGVPIGGADPINNLSAMLYRYGFEAVGRAGWRIRQQENAETSPRSADENTEGPGLHCRPRSNGVTAEIHGAAIL